MRQDLSLGLLLLTEEALRAASAGLSAPDRQQWDVLDARWEAERTSHAAAIRNKARAEFPRRVGLWRAYLQELAEKPSECGSYPTEVRHRLIADRLGDVMGERASSRPDLGTLDRRLRAWFMAGPFVWEDHLRAVYPEDRYWYLYGRPAPERILANPPGA